jgi:hypothetical protein
LQKDLLGIKNDKIWTKMTKNGVKKTKYVKMSLFTHIYQIWLKLLHKCIHNREILIFAGFLFRVNNTVTRLSIIYTNPTNLGPPWQIPQCLARISDVTVQTLHTWALEKSISNMVMSVSITNEMAICENLNFQPPSLR